MYELYAERSPNVFKIAVMLEELGADWQAVWIDVSRGAQHAPDFLALCPNGRIPVLVDHAPADGGAPQTLWESGAILLYLAEKHGAMLPPPGRARSDALVWLFWQMGGLGPMGGQSAHFLQYDPPGSDYSKQRYHTEVARLYGVLDGQLAGRDWIAGDYSIADMACYPWVRLHGFLHQDIAVHPRLADWNARMEARPAVQSAYARIDALPATTATVEERFAAMLPSRGAEAQAALR